MAQGVPGDTGPAGPPGTTLHASLTDTATALHPNDHAATPAHHSNANDHVNSEAAHNWHGAHHTAFVQADHDALANPHHSNATDHARLHSVIGASAHNGFPGGTTTFLRADWAFAAPPGGGSADPIILPKSGNIRTCFLYHRDAVGLSTAMEPSVRISELPEHNYTWQVYISTSLAAVRILDAGVVTIDIDESA